MSKLQDDPVTTPVSSEQFIELCRKNKHEEIRDLLKKLTPDEINTIIHANNDEAFKVAAAPERKAVNNWYGIGYSP